MNKETEDLKEIGKIINAHGIKGDAYIYIFSGDTQWFSELVEVSIQISNQISKKIEFYDIRPFKKGILAKLKGYQDRTAVETLKGAKILVSAQALISEDGESLFLSEILNFSVETEDNTLIGVIKGFSYNGAYDLLTVEGKNKTYDIPFVDEFVLSVDHKLQKIKMSLPEGILDINEKD